MRPLPFLGMLVFLSLAHVVFADTEPKFYLFQGAIYQDGEETSRFMRGDKEAMDKFITALGYTKKDLTNHITWSKPITQKGVVEKTFPKKGDQLWYFSSGGYLGKVKVTKVYLCFNDYEGDYYPLFDFERNGEDSTGAPGLEFFVSVPEGTPANRLPTVIKVGPKQLKRALKKMNLHCQNTSLYQAVSVLGKTYLVLQDNCSDYLGLMVYRLDPEGPKRICLGWRDVD
jgi:hypothetical protein